MLLNAVNRQNNGPPWEPGLVTPYVNTDASQEISELGRVQHHIYGASVLDEKAHHENVARVHEQVHALIGKLDPYSSPDDIRSAVSKNIAAIIREAKLDLLPYQAKGSEKDAYGKYLLFSSLSLNNVHLREAPFCFQLFYFDPTQTTPIHNHPCECASLVVRGQINERQYVRCGDSKVIKIKKDSRRSGSRCEVDFHEKNSPHSIKNKGVKRAITVHVYSIDGISPNQTVAVKERFLKAPDGRADRKPHEDVRSVMG